MYALAVVAVILCILFKVLNINRSPEKSLFYCADAWFLEQILKHAPRLVEPYAPTRLWGYSGHAQTILQGFLSRVHCPLVNGKRFHLKSHDGALVTYDLYHPLDSMSSDDDITLAIAPGICNSSESVYIRRVVYHAQFQGYRVAVLNHVGALKCVPVVTPRIFGGGHTDDYDLVIKDLGKRFPGTKFICIGFSMGGNMVTKYLGEKKPMKRIIAGLSVCQGYDAAEATKQLLLWESFKRLYFFAMTENMKAILRHWQKELFTDEVKRSKGINERAVWASATLVELDEEYTRKIHGYPTVEEMYKDWSCCNFWENIEIPMVFINATDDPIVPPSLVNKVKKMAEKKDNFLVIEQKYGGHLGFYEGGFIYPHAVTWLDKTVIDLSFSLSVYATSKFGRNLEKIKNKNRKSMSLAPGQDDTTTGVIIGGAKTDHQSICCERMTTIDEGSEDEDEIGNLVAGVGAKKMGPDQLMLVEMDEKKITGSFDFGNIAEVILLGGGHHDDGHGGHNNLVNQFPKNAAKTKTTNKPRFICKKKLTSHSK